MSEEGKDKGQLDIQDLLRIAPHRYPFLMVDRVLESDQKHVLAIKNVTYNEPCFTGHFPERPVFPGVLMVEAMAQVGGLVVLNRPENAGKLAFFTAIDGVKFRRQVTPGDQMKIRCELVKERGPFSVVHGSVTVDGETCCEGTIKFVISEEQRAV